MRLITVLSGSSMKCWRFSKPCFRPWTSERKDRAFKEILWPFGTRIFGFWGGFGEGAGSKQPCDRAETKPKPKKTAAVFHPAGWLQYFLKRSKNCARPSSPTVTRLSESSRSSRPGSKPLGPPRSLRLDPPPPQVEMIQRHHHQAVADLFPRHHFRNLGRGHQQRF